MSGSDAGGRRNVRTRRYRELFDPLPNFIKELAVERYRQFCENPQHPSLRHHKLDDAGSLRPGSYSVSINMNYRAVYVVDGDCNVWYWCGTHGDYNRFTGQGG